MLDVLIADLTDAIENPTAGKILELEKSGKLAAATRLKLATLDELPAFILFGGRGGNRTTTNLRTGEGASARGGPSGFPGAPTPSAGFGSATPPSTAVQFQATTRVEDDGSIIMQFYLDRPETAVPEKLLPIDASSQAWRNFTLLSRSTVRLKPGQACLVAGRQSASGGDQSQTWIVISAEVGEAPVSKSKQ
jgi:hypothetical protein